MRNVAIGLAIALALVTLGLRSLFVVDETKTAIVTQFGRPVRSIADPGLHFKFPWQSRRLFERRMMVLDPPATELLTGEKKNVTVDFFLVWKIADAQKFLVGVRDLPGAEDRLFEILFSEMSAALGRYELADLLNAEKPSKLGELAESVSRACAETAREEYGIEVVDVRIKRLNFPYQNRPSVFARMRAERDREAQRYRSEGQAQYDIITSNADLEVAGILSGAYAKAEKIRGEGDARRTDILNVAIARDPEFYEFTRTLEVYRNTLNESTTLVLGSNSHFLRPLVEGPSVVGPPPADSPADDGQLDFVKDEDAK